MYVATCMQIKSNTQVHIIIHVYKSPPMHTARAWIPPPPPPAHLLLDSTGTSMWQTSQQFTGNNMINKHLLHAESEIN